MFNPQYGLRRKTSQGTFQRGRSRKTRNDLICIMSSSTNKFSHWQLIGNVKCRTEREFRLLGPCKPGKPKNKLTVNSLNGYTELGLTPPCMCIAG